MNIFEHYSNVFTQLLLELDDFLLETFEDFEAKLLEDQTNRIEFDNTYVDEVAMQTDKGIKAGLPYAPRTMKKKGNPKGVNLKDTGAFYASFKIDAKKDSYSFQANFKKDNGEISDNFTSQTYDKQGFADAVLGITVEDWDFIGPLFIETLLNEHIITFLKNKL